MNSKLLRIALLLLLWVPLGTSSIGTASARERRPSPIASPVFANDPLATPATEPSAEVNVGERGAFQIGVRASSAPSGGKQAPVETQSLPVLDFCGRTVEEAASHPWNIQYQQATSTSGAQRYFGICPTGDGGGSRAIDALFFRPELVIDVAPPLPDPAVVAQQAIDTIQFPIPQPHLGPEELLAVNRWIYLTVDNNPGTLTADAAVPGLAISATATLTSSTWSMGEITAVDRSGTVAPFTCTGSGVTPSPTANLHANQPQEPGTCAYAYKFRSLPERTGGTGTWPVTVTTTWSITWTATDGTTGTATRSQTSDPLPASVGEWQSVLVPG